MSFNTSDIYLGIWRNWSKEGAFEGSTITMRYDAASILTSFLAIYVSLTTTHLWHIIAYFAQRMRQRSSILQDSITQILHQQDELLRSRHPPAVALFHLTCLYWKLRSTPHAFKNTAPLAFLSLLFAVGTIITGLFSSRIVDWSSDIEVLLQSPNCGFTASNNDSDYNAMLSAMRIWNAANANAQQCYDPEDPGFAGYDGCDMFVQQIPWTTESPSACPFDATMCTEPALRLVTDFINSNTGLGINAVPDDQIQMKKVTTCAPIQKDGYVRKTNDTFFDPDKTLFPGEELILAFYSPGAGVYTWNTTTFAANRTAMREMT